MERLEGTARRVRWGVLSTANIATEKVIPGFRRSPRSEVLGIASREDGRAREVAARLGIPRAYGSYEAMLADPDIDAVYNPLPNHLHAEWTIAAARAGKHVLCEKPLALTADEAQGMVDACRAAGVLLMEAFMYRQHPSWLAVRDLVRSGRIGRLQAVDSWFSYFNDDTANIRNIREAGGGALYDIGCYCVNLSRMLFDAEPVGVQAAITRDPDLGVDVLTSGILSFPTGVATFTCSTRTETDQRVHVYGTRAGSRSRSRSTSRPTARPGSSSRPVATRRSHRRPRRSRSTPPIPTPARPTGSRTPCSTASRCRWSPRTPSPTCGSSTRCSQRAADRRRAPPRPEAQRGEPTYHRAACRRQMASRTTRAAVTAEHAEPGWPPRWWSSWRWSSWAASRPSSSRRGAPRRQGRRASSRRRRAPGSRTRSTAG